MKKSFQYVLAVAAAAVAAFSLSACGDDVTEVNENSYMAVLESGKKLSKQPCSSTNVGELLFVKDSSATFVCDGDGWASLKGKDGNPGEDGNDGSSCTVKQIEKNKRTGYVLTCGKNVVDTLWNGTDGKDGYDGTDGKDGAGCNIVSEKNGIVTLACGEGETADTTTLFKMTCGAVPYEPTTHYCLQGVLLKYEVFEDERDGQTYKTIEIGEQTWMAENLNYGDSSQTPNLTGATWCGGGEDESEGDCSKYGRLYTWAAAIDKAEDECGYEYECEGLEESVQGICPEGWHLPSYQEFETLINVADSDFGTGSGEHISITAGWFFKSVQGWNDYRGEIGFGNDAYGFSALPAGGRYCDGFFSDVGARGLFWSSSMHSNRGAYFMGLYHNNEEAVLIHDSKEFAFSVRCLQN